MYVYICIYIYIYVCVYIYPEDMNDEQKWRYNGGIIVV